MKLSQSNINTKQAQSLVVVLPDKKVTKDVGAPAAGGKFYYSGAADRPQHDHDAERHPACGLGNADRKGPVEHRGRLRLRLPHGRRPRRPRPTSRTRASSLTASRAARDGDWETLTADLSAFADGGSHQVRFGYITDGGVQGADSSLPAGFAVDDIAITGQPTDGAETDPGWTFASNQSDQGFHITTGTETFSYFNAYIAEYRNYGGYDQALKLGPYNFDDPDGNWVTHFPYQDGLLIWYYDTSYSDNNVGDHPGHGLILPVDAHPAIMHNAGRFRGPSPTAVV